MTDKPRDCTTLRVRVRAKQCQGCLFGPKPVVRDYEEGRKIVSDNFAADPTRCFPCHCNYDMDHSEKALMCRGFYEAHKDQMPSARFVDEEGDAEFWKDQTGMGVLG